MDGWREREREGGREGEREEREREREFFISEGHDTHLALALYRHYSKIHKII